MRVRALLLSRRDPCPYDRANRTTAMTCMIVHARMVIASTLPTAVLHGVNDGEDV